MFITDQHVDQVFADLHATCAGVRNDYFGLLYLEREYDVPRQRAIAQVAFGGNDYGVDGFHFDLARRNFYLFQFKYSDAYAQFKGSFERLISAGFERIFDARSQDQYSNQLLQQIRSALVENQSAIERVCIHFVFLGDTDDADRSQVLDKLREDLESKKYLIDKYFERPVSLVIEFRSARARKAGSTAHVRKTHRYHLTFDDAVVREGPGGEQLHLGFVPLNELRGMYREMGPRFLERNIRAAFGEEVATNRALMRAFRRLVLEGKDDPSVFPFNHNGITLFAESMDREQAGRYLITEPRLLNGAQTVATFDRFLKANEDNPGLHAAKDRMAGIRVLAKIVTGAAGEFVKTVTINNNRQNPVEPASLRANDTIQLQLHDWFRDELEVYYERQENAFAGLSDADLEEEGISDTKAIELERLAKTYLVADGEVDRLSRMREVFEEDRFYDQVFSESRLKADPRHVLLCYKIQFRLRKLVAAIVERGTNKYEYVTKARMLTWSLLCQAVLNDPRLNERAESFGKNMTLEADYTAWLASLATKQVRLLLSDLVADKAYAAKVAEGNFSFLRTNAAYKRAMELAHRRWRWVQKRLR